MIQNIVPLFEKLRRHYLIPGAQLAVYHQGELHELVSGVERIGAHRTVTRSSRFALGSVSKIFTAALIMQLVEDGDVDLDRPITDLVPHAVRGSGDPAGAITPRHLLSHTAGLVSDHDEGSVTAASLRRQAQSVLAKGIVSEPGAAFSYSNGAYSLAAYLVEAVTGQDWWEALESFLVVPTGLQLGFLHDARDPRAATDVVSGHTVDLTSGTVTPVDFYIEPALTPAGGLAGTATDLVNFGRAFMGSGDSALDFGIAHPDVLREMGCGVPAADAFGLADGWGAGWALHHAGDRLWLGHDGTLDGGTCNVRVDPNGGTAIALTTNATTGLQLWEDLLHGFRDSGLEVGHYRQPVRAIRTHAPRREITGRYVNGDLILDVTRTSDGRFSLNLSNGTVGQLTPAADLQFSASLSSSGGMAFSGRFLCDPADPLTVSALQYNGRTLLRTPSPAGAATTRSLPYAVV
ncbi:MAG: serine hydrolase domain-containing protein [Propionibacteriaceae bacterium]|nr:serine hydrolase domain-containing protein [Propionibacteriaceae bacterium]